MATKFYRCRHCGNVIVKLVDSKVPVVCCGEKMTELLPDTVDASIEKHVPVVTKVDECTLKVEIGSQPHPMTHLSMLRQKTVECMSISRISLKLSSVHAKTNRLRCMSIATFMGFGRRNFKYQGLAIMRQALDELFM